MTAGDGNPACSKPESGATSESSDKDVFQIIYEGGSPQQGDVLQSFPYLYPFFEKGELDIYSEEWNVIILGNSCDMEKHEERHKVDLVLLCPIWEINDYFENCIHRLGIDKKYNSQFKNGQDFKKHVKTILEETSRNKRLGYMALPSAPASEIHPEGSEPFLVDFTNAYSLPLDVLNDFATKDKKNAVKLRLKTDYRIDMISRFNYFLVRAIVPAKEFNYKDHIKPIIKDSQIDNLLKDVKFDP